MSEPSYIHPSHQMQPGRLVIFSDPVPYSDAWQLQQRWHAERMENRRSDTLMLLQHEPVYTMGRRTAPTHLPLSDTGLAVESVNRGGSITYHGPGQLIGYPILKLAQFASGPKDYVWLLEEVLIRTLALWDIEGHRLHKKPGVFVRLHGHESKIASIGIRVERGITLHGFAVNVDLDLLPFTSIVPCGLEGCVTTSMAEIRRSSVPFALVTEQVSTAFADLFKIFWKYDEPAQIDMVSSVTCAHLQRSAD